MPRKRNQIADYATYLLGRLVVMLAGMLPLRWDYALARAVGAQLFRWGGVHRRRALGHLRRSFPDWPDERIEQVARASGVNLACMAVETLLADRKIRPDTWRRHFCLRNLSEMIRLAVERRAGLVLVTGHFGNWEVAGYLTAAIGLPTVTVARKIQNPYMNRHVIAVRQKAGQRIVDKTGAAGEVEAAMVRRESASMVCDQDAGRKGLFVDFFGRKASTYKSIGLLALVHEAPIVVIGCRRLPGEYRFEIAAQRVIRPSEWADRADPLRWITQEYTAAMESIVRSDPPQYFWVHRRWKHRPKGEEAAPDGIA